MTFWDQLVPNKARHQTAIEIPLRFIAASEFGRTNQENSW
jgi:hypothetical protein